MNKKPSNQIRATERDDAPYDFSSIENIPGVEARAAFTTDSSAVFKESQDMNPVRIDDKMEYMPWGADNQMPYGILKLIENDETLSTCQMFNAEIAYGDGLRYNMDGASAKIKAQVGDFLLSNDLPSYYLGVCQDLKHFAFCVSVIILNGDNTRIVRLLRKEACYCRFAPADKNGDIPYVLYANWRESSLSRERVEKIPLLSVSAPWADLAVRMGLMPDAEGKRKARTREHKFAIVTRIPTPDSTYYPIPYYAALFKGKWYNIKQLIGIAKESKLKNTAPIKYHIEIANKYWENLFRSEGITDRKLQQERVKRAKQEILDFLTGVENSGKVWFSCFYRTPDGQETHEVVINKIDTDKEGGDWATDIAEAINIICFTMRVHSNLVGSVPGKSQSNNSGSDKRELYTIAQALQKPYHDLLFTVHRIIIKFNGWDGVYPDCPFIQLTTLDENKDAKKVTVSKKEVDA